MASFQLCSRNEAVPRCVLSTILAAQNPWMLHMPPALQCSSLAVPLCPHAGPDLRLLLSAPAAQGTGSSTDKAPQSTHRMKENNTGPKAAQSSVADKSLNPTGETHLGCRVLCSPSYHHSILHHGGRPIASTQDTTCSSAAAGMDGLCVRRELQMTACN